MREIRQPATIGELLAEQPSHATALQLPDEQRRISYGELVAQAEQLARVLASSGIQRGDRVALALPNGPTYLQVLLAVLELGALAAPLNPAYTGDEYSFYLADLAPRLLIVPSGELAAARAAATKAKVAIVEVVTTPDGAPGLVKVGVPLRAESHYEPAAPDDVALLLHTSGTTSRPKQVPLLQRNLTASALNIAAFYKLGPTDVSYCAMPLFHVHGLVASTLGALAAGGTVVVPGRFSARRLWPQLHAHDVSWFSAGPTLHQMILERRVGLGPPPSLRFLRSCSSALPATLMATCEDVYGVPMLEAYGMTEASHQMASNPLPPLERVAGSVGVSAGAELRIVDPAGDSLSDGASGEVVIRGPGVISGYLANPQADAEAFYGDWFRTGDVGVLQGGRLRLEGRIKEMINRGGEKISPYEIEATLLRHPAVVDAVCFGVPDERYGELVAAAVTLRAESDEHALQSFCRERLAAFKVPKTIHILDAIPRTATGKVQRKRIGAQIGVIEA
jgi:acyl-CoA synthetase (AMP-forming)/AMP-acid ligase II